jgi:glutamine synthetase
MDNKAVLKLIKDEDVDYVDIRFTDPRGKLQHVTVVADLVDEDFLEEGFMFDGSSIAGWKSIDQSDMKLLPQAESAYLDPFYAEKTLCIHCNIVEPDTMEPYARDPRGTAVKAEQYLISSGIGDTAYFGPEAEFFVFDTKWAIPAIVPASRAAISPSTRLMMRRKCALKCCPP